MIQLKRVYDPPGESDGFRVLVDRLWPRGLSKQRTRLNAWKRELAPSEALRRWFNHDPSRWEEFRESYLEELHSPESQRGLAELAQRAQKGTVTLLYAAQDRAHNNAVVLKEVLERWLDGKGAGDR